MEVTPENRQQSPPNPTLFMKKYDFDRIFERRGTGSIKYDDLKERYGRSDLIPLWVADMDFETPPFIVDALKQRMEHAIFGYPQGTQI